MGDSTGLRIGETVVAIGNALGLEGGPTVTVGVVSAKGRSETVQLLVVREGQEISLSVALKETPRRWG